MIDNRGKDRCSLRTGIDYMEWASMLNEVEPLYKSRYVKNTESFYLANGMMSS